MPELTTASAAKGSADYRNPHIDRINWLLAFLATASLFTACVLLFYIWRFYDKTPVIFSDDDGYVMNRQVMLFKLDENRIKTYLELVLGKLFNTNPGYYTIDEMAPLIDERLLKKYTTIFRSSDDIRARTYERQMFELFGVRRFRTDDPNDLIVVVRGQMNIFRAHRSTGDLLSRDSQTTGAFQVKTATYLVYIARDIPSSDNPWGLIVTRISPQTKPDVADRIWENAPPLDTTVLDGNQILKIQRDSLKKSGQSSPTQ
jgi:hypothetical protein